MCYNFNNMTGASTSGEVFVRLVIINNMVYCVPFAGYTPVILNDEVQVLYQAHLKEKREENMDEDEFQEEWERARLMMDTGRVAKPWFVKIIIELSTPALEYILKDHDDSGKHSWSDSFIKEVNSSLAERILLDI